MTNSRSSGGVVHFGSDILILFALYGLLSLVTGALFLFSALGAMGDTLVPLKGADGALGLAAGGYSTYIITRVVNGIRGSGEGG